MKKKYFFGVILIIFALSACWTEAPHISLDELPSSDPLQTLPKLEGYINMSISEIRPNSVTVAIQNYSDIEVGTGLAFSLEVYNNMQWLNIPFQYGYGAVPDIGFIVKPEDWLSLVKDLSVFYSVGEGLHRIRKEVSNHEVVAEFFIENR